MEIVFIYKTCSLHFCRVFQSAKGAVDTLEWTQRISLHHHQKVIEIVWSLKPVFLQEFDYLSSSDFTSATFLFPISP